MEGQEWVGRRTGEEVAGQRGGPRSLCGPLDEDWPVNAQGSFLKVKLASLCQVEN